MSTIAEHLAELEMLDANRTEGVSGAMAQAGYMFLIVHYAEMIQERDPEEMAKARATVEQRLREQHPAKAEAHIQEWRDARPALRPALIREEQAAPPVAQPVDAGKWMPKEPSEEMLKAGMAHVSRLNDPEDKDEDREEYYRARGCVICAYSDMYDAAPPAPSAPEARPVMWEYRHWSEHRHPPGWGAWERVLPRNIHTDTDEDRVREIQAYIASGYKYELRALFAHPPADHLPDASKRVAPEARIEVEMLTEQETQDAFANVPWPEDGPMPQFMDRTNSIQRALIAKINASSGIGLVVKETK